MSKNRNSIPDPSPEFLRQETAIRFLQDVASLKGSEAVQETAEAAEPPEDVVNPFVRETSRLRRGYDLDFEIHTTSSHLHNTLKALTDVPISVQSLQTVETFAKLSREMLELLGKR